LSPTDAGGSPGPDDGPEGSGRPGWARWSLSEPMTWEVSGLANVELGVPFGSATRVNLGSVAKVLTGALARQVWPTRTERESTPLRSVLPELAGHWLGEASIEALLTHATGLFDFRAVLELSGRSRRGFVTRSQIMQMAIMQASPAREPVQYSNTGYVLLRTALEMRTRTSVSALLMRWAEDRAVGFLRTDFEGLVAGRADGYRRSEHGELRRWNFTADDAGASNYWGSLAEAVSALELVAAGDPADHKVYGAIETVGPDDTWLAIGDDGGFSSAILVRKGVVTAGAVSNLPDAPAITLIEGSLYGLEFLQPPHLVHGLSPRDSRPVTGLQPGAYHHEDFDVEIEVVAQGGMLFILAGGRRYPLLKGGTYGGWLVRGESDQDRLVADFGHLRAIEFLRH